MVTRFDKRSGQARDISVWPLRSPVMARGDLKYRFQWTSPMFLSPHDPDVLYTAAECGFQIHGPRVQLESHQRDLTRNDKSKQKPPADH